MLAGHFGVAAALKAKVPEAPLWALMLGSQALDVLFVPCLLGGAEGLVPVAGHGYAAALIRADYTHSLLGTLLLALVAGLAGGRAWGRRAGVAVGVIVASHWFLDLLMHRPDLPLLPGNALGLPRLGFGLWQFPVASAVLELAVIAWGAALYGRSLLRQAPAENRFQARTAGRAVAIGLFATLALDVWGIG